MIAIMTRPFWRTVATLILVIIVTWQGFKHYIQQQNKTTDKNIQVAIHVKTAGIGTAASTKQREMDLPDGAAVNPEISAHAEYMRLFNEYQVAQLQRLIAENNEAIAVAKRNAAQAASEMAKLLSGTQLIGKNPGSTGYELIFTSQQSDGSWTATLKKHGQTFNIVIGKKLADGAKVIAVDDSSVLLSKDNGTKELITFSGDMKMSANQAIVQSPAGQAM